MTEDENEDGGNVLEVRVVHGSLEFATEPVAVGHYQGMPISGAEGFPNEQLGGLLADRLLLGVYAEEEGTALLVGPLPERKPPGAVVLGLGPAGEVTAGDVTRAMTEAVLKRCLAAAEKPSEPASAPTTVGVSTVLVGSNPLDGMTVEASVAALVDGTVAAVQLLRSNPRLWAKVRLGYLEIIERYEQRAQLAISAVKAITERNDSDEAEVVLRAADTISGGEAAGGAPGQPQETYNAQAWMRLDIRSLPDSPDLPAGCREIEFTSMARRARADRLVQRTETALVNDLIARAVTQAKPSLQISSTLYELLVPGEVKYDLLNADNIHLLLDGNTACYPWEALAPRGAGDDKPPAWRMGLLRQFAERDTRHARLRVRRATGRNVLVIGNPPAGDDFRELPEATREAQKVAAFLADRAPAAQHKVHSIIWGDDGLESQNLSDVSDNQSWVHIVNALYRHEYRIVHIAAHGVFNPDDPTQSGVVIGPGNHFLTAMTVSCMPVVPELVFLNCCHLGQMSELSTGTEDDRQVNLLAASLARSLMGIGVRAVIAAGWAVEDEAAALFATTFYEHALARGQGFGEAVRAARCEVRKKSDSLTWAAYQCYGDPEFRLQASSDW